MSYSCGRILGLGGWGLFMFGGRSVAFARHFRFVWFPLDCVRIGDRFVRLSFHLILSTSVMMLPFRLLCSCFLQQYLTR